jgi:c-di-GMP-binding flagellar brake protein YcgR
MSKERRQVERFDLLLNLKVRSKKEETEYQWGITRNFCHKGLSFEINIFKLEPNEKFELKIQDPKNNTFISVLSDIVWNKEMYGRCLAGIKFREIDEEAKSEILNYANKINKKAMRDKAVRDKAKGSGLNKIKALLGFLQN